MRILRLRSARSRGGDRNSSADAGSEESGCARLIKTPNRTAARLPRGGLGKRSIPERIIKVPNHHVNIGLD